MKVKRHYQKYIVTPLDLVDATNPANKKDVKRWSDELNRALEERATLDQSMMQGNITDSICGRMNTLELRIQALRERIQKYSNKVGSRRKHI